MIRKVEWKEHIGISANIEIVKILEIVYGLICNLELVTVPIYFVYHLVTIKNTLHTAIFLLSATFIILFYEKVLPLLMIFFAFKMLHILYTHEIYLI